MCDGECPRCLSLKNQNNVMGRPYKTINFDEDWAEQIEDYLDENPEEGFDSDQLKGFIKYVLNKYMADNVGMFTRQEIKMLKDMKDLDD